MRNNLLLLLIVVVGFGLRIFNLANLPPALNWDEVSHGYNAYSILKTGGDEWGKQFPIINFRAYGDYPLPLNLYLTIPFIYLLGLSELSIRLPHAVLGTLTIISGYYLASGITKRKSIGLLTAFFIAIDPWTLFTSRFVLQSNLAVFFLTSAAALFVNRERSKWFLPLSLISLYLTLFSYNTTRIVSPLILISAIAIYWKKVKLPHISVSLIILFFFTLPIIFFNPTARSRSNEVFLVDQGVVAGIIEKRQSSNLPALVSRILYNRPLYLAINATKNYVEYFSPKFLFIKGGTQYQFSVPNFGLMYISSLPFFYIGIYFLVKKAKLNRDFALTVCWLLLAPLPAAITKERFAVIRSSAMLPLPQLICAIGLVGVYEKLKTLGKQKLVSRLTASLFFLCLLLSFIVYLSHYINEYPKNYSSDWQYGYKEAIKFTETRYNNYDKIIITKKYGEPHEFLLFWLAWDPNSYITDPQLNRFSQSNWYWVDGFDKFYFMNDWQVKDMKLESGGEIDCEDIKCLLITSPGNVPSGWDKLETINFLDDSSAFEIYEKIK